MSLGETSAPQGSPHPAQGPGPHTHPHGHQPLSQLLMVGDGRPGRQGVSQPSQKHQGCPSPSIKHLSGDRGMPSSGWNGWAKIFPRIKGNHIFQRMHGPPELNVGTGHMWRACNGSSHRPWSFGVMCQLQYVPAQAAWNHPFSEETSEQSRNDTAISWFSA